MTFLNDNNPTVTPERLAELESQLDNKLPQDYKSFLLEHNGGTPEKTLFQIPDCDGDALVDYFLGIDRPNGDLLDWKEELADDLGEEYLPIAFDPGGNALLLKLSEGTILYWDSARHFPVSTDEENTFWIADSFTQLLSSLRKFDS
jgi:cell wall assembly regulator SMI1